MYSTSEFFHPTFLYESIWNLLLFGLLMLLFRRGLKAPGMLPSGAMSCMYLVGYSLGLSGSKVCALILSASVRFHRLATGESASPN